ncbi:MULTISPECIES: caspase family protein [Streptomyces]|uniref:Peptidase C14 caspase domain-containing protein n=2 Tax=Streptomyces TaxID=1883 RepID=A0A124ED75_9ACTN|nr:MULTISPECIES: caspase family protein [Streptomyces]KUH39891.1 hypothetical protein ATE80_04865 [Streptomyces kanasensis]UUS32246.1 caspase family protein [Streptomyces changanensis]
MATVYALFVGIDDYPAGRWPRLSGCLNDIEAGHRWLMERLGAPPSVRALTDRTATIAAVTAAVTGHLGQAGPGDTALLWFSGHGTEYAAVTPQERLVEATGRCQALVCADGPLPDKRLGALLDAVAARGAHVLAVLDCCYSGGATRDPDGEPDAVARYAPPLPEWTREPAPAPPAAPVARDTAGPAAPRHVLLAGSRLDQRAYERDFAGRRHGVFTRALLGALRAAPPAATYREVLAAANARVQRDERRQHPVLAPAEPGGPADGPVLGGLVRPPAPHLLRYGTDGWEVDCGGAHGLREGTDTAGATAFMVTGDATLTGHDATPTGRGVTGTGGGVTGTGGGPVVRARRVQALRTLVTPDGWHPDRTRAYPVAPSSLALPPLAVRLEGPDAAVVAAALATAGPGGGASPLLHTGAAARPDGLRRVVTGGGEARVLRRDGTPVVAALPLTGPADARRVARCLVHLARWHQLHALDNPASPLAGLVRVEVSPWTPGRYAPALTPDAAGELVLHYAGRPGAWHRPEVAIRVHNHGPRPLWAVLVDLTDSHAAHTGLYEGHFIGPHGTAHVFDGDPVELSLPPTRPERPGAEVRDWFKLIVAEGELNTAPFRLPPWDPHADARDAPSGPPVDGVLHLAGAGGGGSGGTGGARDTGPSRRPAPGQWWTTTVPVRTVVPRPSGRGT